MSTSRQSPDHEVVVPVDPAPRPIRRTFTSEYKARVIVEYESAVHGQKSAVLRREGLFHSHIQEWTRARDAAAKRVVPAGAGSGRASAPGRMSRAERNNVRLLAENERLKARLAQTTVALAIMGKAHELLASLAESSDEPTSSSR